MVYERNSSLESGHQWNVLKDYQPSYAIFGKCMPADKALDTRHQDPGIFTTPELKNDYARSINFALEKNKIFFYCGWKCTNPNLPAATRRATTRTELFTQLRNCRLKTPNMDTTHVGYTSSFTTTWSGKIGSNGKVILGQNDDLAFAFGQGLYWVQRIHKFDRPFDGFPYDTIFPGMLNQRSYLSAEGRS